MIRKILPLLLLPLLLFAEEDEEEDYSDFSIEEEQCDCKKYNPLRRYYPYRRIFQDSKVRECQDDDQPSWPGRRESDLWDELTR